MILAIVLGTSGSAYQIDASALSLTRESNKSTSITPKISKQSIPMNRSIPTRIQIPSLNLDSRLMKLGLLKNGSLQVPPTAFPAGWYTGSPTPGEMGPSIIAGHIDWNGPGVFYNLNKMRLGDRISIARADGSTASFVVTRMASFLKRDFPTEAVYGDLNHPGLRLITCGDYDFTRHKYIRDLVVFAKLIS
ncbi:MAG TPA: class F sortase [Candidatus Nanopelagicaceae bacterium]|nr:class F sortase [Candidatus Nanopelagicaceae bacterium]